MPLVAIVGRPNVGKSTLFNRLVEERKAIVDDQPGVTRDRIYGECIWNGRTFDVVDTGGFVPNSADRFEAAIREQVDLAIEEADAILFVVDVTVGISELDMEMASKLRKAGIALLLISNKADNDARRLDSVEFYNLGLGEVYSVSSINGSGTGDMLDELVKLLPPESEEDEVDDDIPRIAVIGRPNVGKSSLVNKLLGYDRSIVTEIAGTTRDAINSTLKFKDQEITMIDTAGLRRQARIKENVEFYSTLRTERAIQNCHVAILLVDATVGLEAQDIRVLTAAEQLKKGMVIAINKWDLVEKETNTARDLERSIHERLKTLDYIPVEFISALTGKRATRILERGLEVFHERKKRVSTSKLNDFVEKAVRAHRPAAYRGNPVKILYATQVKTEPPVIAFFVNHPKGVQEGYRRYLANRFRDEFGFEGVPLTLSIRDKN